jgi:hypothetical protein
MGPYAVALVVGFASGLAASETVETMFKDYCRRKEIEAICWVIEKLADLSK